MSEHETEEQQETETAERPFLVREFVAADLAVEGRTVDVRLVPFGEVARVADPPKFTPYQEEWLPGVFDHQLNAASRIHAKYGHSETVLDVVGHGVALRSEPGDGYHVQTKIHQTPQGDTALELLRDGGLPCVSLEARPVKNITTAAGVVQRAKANLLGFAFCRQGAFAGARVLAIREETTDEITIDEDCLPIAPDANLIARAQALGIELPERYQPKPRDEMDVEVEEIIARAMIDTPWDGSASRWPTAEAYCASSAIDLNPSGQAKTKDACHLPYKEPNGDINLNAVRNALSRIGQGDPKDATQAQRDKARATLEAILQRSKKGN